MFQPSAKEQNIPQRVQKSLSSSYGLECGLGKEEPRGEAGK